MNETPLLRRLLAHDAWANRAVLEALRGDRAAPPACAKLLAHVLAAELLWLSRLRGEASPVAVWPDPDLTWCAGEVERLPGLWTRFLDESTPASLSGSIDYRNSKGEPWRSRVEDVLLHVATHSAYHRGQIAARLRAAGLEVPYTDFIEATRRGLVG
jgi:uncharacterized damage-inducible protein DinB